MRGPSGTPSLPTVLCANPIAVPAVSVKRAFTSRFNEWLVMAFNARFRHVRPIRTQNGALVHNEGLNAIESMATSTDRSQVTVPRHVGQWLVLKLEGQFLRQCILLQAPAHVHQDCLASAK